CRYASAYRGSSSMALVKLPIASTLSFGSSQKSCFSSMNTKNVHAHGLILAIDLGQYKRVLCVSEPAELSWPFTNFTTHRAERLKVREKYRPRGVGIEGYQGKSSGGKGEHCGITAWRPSLRRKRPSPGPVASAWLWSWAGASGSWPSPSAPANRR